ncbi:MAG TPA: APA family fibronectin-binding glycoprotein [Mycobacterium sp.]|nr:APA family fibronectin-binding glycoprotein [Mycobacterium sp.]
MIQPESPLRRPGLWRALAVTAVAGASAVTIALPPNLAIADPVPPSTTTAAPAPAAPAPAPPAPAPADPDAASPAAPPPAAPADPNAAPAPAPTPAPPADPNATAPPPADPNAPPPAPADPNAPPAAPADSNAVEPGRVTNAAGGFSYVVPAGWEVADASRLSYGQALLLKQTAPSTVPGQPAPTANDTSILLGRLDLKLFAGAEADNSKAAVRLASDMGEFFMPFPGTRINQATSVLQAGDMPGASASYDVKFTDTAKPNGQIWAGVVGATATGTAARVPRNERWFVVWLGTGKDPIDPVAAKALAESIRPYTPPPAPTPDPEAPAAPPAPGNRVGVPVPVETPVPEMMPAG